MHYYKISFSWILKDCFYYHQNKSVNLNIIRNLWISDLIESLDPIVWNPVRDWKAPPVGFRALGSPGPFRVPRRPYWPAGVPRVIPSSRSGRSPDLALCAGWPPARRRRRTLAPAQLPWCPRRGACRSCCWARAWGRLPCRAVEARRAAGCNWRPLGSWMASKASNKAVSPPNPWAPARPAQSSGSSARFPLLHQWKGEGPRGACTRPGSGTGPLT